VSQPVRPPEVRRQSACELQTPGVSAPQLEEVLYLQEDDPLNTTVTTLQVGWMRVHVCVRMRACVRACRTVKPHCCCCHCYEWFLITETNEAAAQWGRTLKVLRKYSYYRLLSSLPVTTHSETFGSHCSHLTSLSHSCPCRHMLI
jgi:hypothetical protein